MKTTQVIAYAVECSRCGFEGPPCPTRDHAKKAAREDWGFRGNLCGGCRSESPVIPKSAAQAAARRREKKRER